MAGKKAYGKEQKAIQRINEFKNEFKLSANKTLFCNFCSEEVNPDRKSTVENHLKSKKHVRAKMNTVHPDNEQQFFGGVKSEFLYKLISAFTSTDMPIKKARNKEMKELFEYMKFPLPCESTLRNYITEKYAIDIQKKVKNYFKNDEIFILCDESSIKKGKYFNIFAGKIKEPSIIYLLEVHPLDTNPSSELCLTKLFLTLEKYNIKHEQVKLFLSDAASYMVTMGNMMKKVIPDLFHVFCLAHLIHNCAVNLKSFYTKTDNLIKTMKRITIKNSNNQILFDEIGPLPQVIVTRWNSWLKAAIFYSEKLIEIRNLSHKIDNTGIQSDNAIKALYADGLVEELIEIKRCYENLTSIMENFEDDKYNLESAYEAINSLEFIKDPVKIKPYLEKRLDKNDARKIINLQNKNISPLLYSNLLNCPGTTIVVERSFSMLKNMLRDDRNFSDKNVNAYFLSYYNTRAGINEECL